MKLSHDFFFRLVIIFGTIGTMAHGVQTFLREPYDPLTPCWGVHGAVLAGGVYALAWAVTKKSWWQDERE